jgi:hypothetical protein
MFFTRIGKVLAHLVLWGSILRIAMCLFIIISPMELDAKEEVVRRYIGGVGLESLGPSIDKAGLALIIGVSLGVLCEISARRQQG